MAMIRIGFILIFILVTSTVTFAQYTIEGRVNLGEDWQPKVYLAAVKKLSDYERTSPDMIVNTAAVNPDGTFKLAGDNLPSEKQFYRIYLMKKQNTDYDACLYIGGDDHNFAHLILQNGSHLTINAFPTSVAPFGEYTVEGDNENMLMRRLARIIFPSYYFHRIKFPTELKFSENKLHTDLINFADTCTNTLVALAAVNNTDFDEYYDRNESFYRSFGERLNQEIPKSIYTKNYLLKVKYYANEEEPVSSWSNGFLMGLIPGLLLTIGMFYYFRKQVTGGPQPNDLTASLTSKELEILQLIGEGKSNKEIASALFVELSTVKSHINKLYSKIGTSNRREAQVLAKQLVQ